MSHPSLPSAALLQQQAEWLAPARARLLRRVNIARCGRVLDLGCGPGAVTGELIRRAAGPVVAVDRDRNVLDAVSRLSKECLGHGEAVAHDEEGDCPAFRPRSVPDEVRFARKAGLSPLSVLPVQADAAKLPFAAESFDLVFCQFTLMWVNAPAVIGEIHRVLALGGHLIAIEPDYEAMIEEPAEIATRELWLAGLARAGAETSIGRKLPGMLTGAGFSTRVDLLDHLAEPSPTRFDLLAELPLLPAEQRSLAAAREADGQLAASGTPCVAHLPVFLVTGKRG